MKTYIRRQQHNFFKHQHIKQKDIKQNINQAGLSGVPRGNVFSPLLFFLHIHAITLDNESEIRLFADDCGCNRKNINVNDTVKLRKDIDCLISWAKKWDMRLKYNMM